MSKRAGNRTFPLAAKRRRSTVPPIRAEQHGDIGSRANPVDATMSNRIGAMSAKAQKAEKAAAHAQDLSRQDAKARDREASRAAHEAAASPCTGSLESRKVRLSGGHVYFMRAGQRRLAAFPWSLCTAAPARRLAPSCPVYAIDLPGYGWSDKPAATLPLPQLADALAEWMQALSLRQAHLTANSFGCQVSAHFAVRHPQRVDRLVFQDRRSTRPPEPRQPP